MRAIVTIIVLLFVLPAQAQERVLVRSGQNYVFVWKHRSAYKAGQKLLQAGVLRSNPKLLIPYLSCIVDAGTKAAVIDSPGYFIEIIVTSGDDAGCRGLVTRGDF